MEVKRWLAWIPAEPRLLLTLGALAGLLLGFAKITEDVVEDEARDFDHAILLALRQPGDPARVIGPPWFEQALIDVTSLGSTTVIALVTAIAVAYLLLARKPGAALLVAVAIIGGRLANVALKFGFDRPRPMIVPQLVTEPSLSYPSGHAMLSAIAYLTLGALLAQAQPQWRMRLFILSAGILLTLLIGMSRVFLGIHWPTDVLAGWTAGAAWALAFWLASRKWASGR